MEEQNTQQTPSDQAPLVGDKHGNDKKVLITVKDPDNFQCKFRIGIETPLMKVIEAYFKQKKITDRDAVKFFYDGTRINGGESPKMLEMDPKDEHLTIDVVTDQIGGF